MRKSLKLLASLLVVCMLVACLPMSALFASAETMTAEPSKNPTIGANWIDENNSLLTPSVVTAASAAAFTSKANGYTFDLTETGYTAIGGTVNAEYAVNVVKNNFGTNGTWSLDFDLNAGAAYTSKTDFRTVLNLGHIVDAAGVKHNDGFRVMLQGTTLHVTKPHATTANAYSWQSVGNIGMTVPNGGTIHFSYVIREYKVIDITISNGTKTFTYSWNIADTWGEGYSVNLLSNFTLSHKNIYIDVSNLKVCSEMPGVTAPTAENNLILTHGNWTSDCPSTWKYPFTSTEDGFYVNTSAAGLAANNSTAYYAGFYVNPFGTKNGYKFDSTKSYVVSANVAWANGSGKHPTTGENVASRVYFYLGTYNGKDILIDFSDKASYRVHKDGKVTTANSALISGIALNEYARITVYENPFGVDVYVNGEFLVNIPIENPSLYTPNFYFRSVGTEVWFKDVAIWENTANGDKYYEGLSSLYSQFTAPGVRTDLDLTALKAALDAYKTGSANTALVPFVSTFAGATKTVVNNLVLDGTVKYSASFAAGLSTSAPNAFVFDANKNTASNAATTAYTVSLFNSGACPMVAGKTYVVEGDVAITDHMNSAVRFCLQLGKDTKNNKDIIFGIQNSSFLINSTNSWQQPAGVQNGLNIATGDDYLHFKYTFSNTNVTFYLASQSGTVYANKTFSMTEFGFDTSSITIDPKLYIRTAKFTVSDLYVGECVEDSKAALNNTVTEYTAKDTDGFTADSVKNFTDALAAANTVLAAYEHYSNAEINAAAAAVVSAFGALEKAAVDVEIGGESVAIDPNNLPVNQRPEGSTKHILGWKNPDGTVYEGTAYVEGLVADYVETKMMTVKFQVGNNGTSIRYIASVDTLDRYNAVGWVFSIADSTPEIGEAGSVQRNSTKVYDALIADGEVVTADDIYGADYSNYLYVFEITDIPAGNADTIIYVRPYVEMEDGTIVYGDIAARSLSGLKSGK